VTLVLQYSARSDRGLVRRNNQDSVYAGPRLLALADGMGGYAGGEVASKVVIAALAPLDDDTPGDDLLAQLAQAIDEGNDAIGEMVGGDPDLDGMGTTLTAILFAGNKLGLAHVGDSRAYLMRGNALTQITHDDTFVQSLVDDGRITAEEAAHHPQRSLLIKALNGQPVEPSLAVREARAGDRYLLCSDGLSGVVSDETMAMALQIPDPQTCADRLIELALKGGGPDNITVIVADVVDVPFGEDAPIVGGAAGDGAEHAPPDSAAARASATTLPRPKPAPVEATPADSRDRRRRRTRLLLLAIVVLAMLLAGALAGRVLLFRYFYVGASDGQVVIYQGLRDSMLGVPLHRVYETSCPASAAADCERISVTDLQQSAQMRVREGFEESTSLDDARADIRRLRFEQMLLPCPPASEPQPGTSTEPTTAEATPSNGEGGEVLPPGAAPEPTSPPASETTASTVPPIPGKDCRQVG
jgi:PPM family protein phosphatase